MRAGSVCALLGPTNGGKTTILQAVAGVLGAHHPEVISGGTINIGTESFAPLPRKILFPLVGLTLQEPFFQISGLRKTVSQEVALTLEPSDVPDVEIQRRVTGILSKLGLSGLSDRDPSTLSGGELQRVALANVLVADPAILLLDEPCHSLDGVARTRLASIIRSLKGSVTTIVADYQLDFAVSVADQFVVLDKGSIVFDGDRPALVEHLPDFRQILPVDSWLKALQTLRSNERGKRYLKMAGIP